MATMKKSAWRLARAEATKAMILRASRMEPVTYAQLRREIPTLEVRYPDEMFYECP
jgi:hypothetical protein